MLRGCIGGSGSGGVSSLTGDSTIISNSLSTGAVTLTLANAAANTVLGNATGSAATPAYTTNPSVSSLTLTSAATGGTNFNIINTSASGANFQITSTGSTSDGGAGYLLLSNVTGSTNFAAMGTSFFRLNNSGVFGFSSSGDSAAAADTGLSRFSAGTVAIGTGGQGNTGGGLITSFLYLINKAQKYNNVNVVGQGIPSIYGTGRSTAQTAAVASVATYTNGAADGSFVVSANVNVTAATTATIATTCTYTDETNTSRTLTFSFSTTAGTILSSITNVTGVGAYAGIPLHIRCKASTSITIATSGTFTSVTYNVEGFITQIG